MPSRISGIGLPASQRKMLELHARACDEDVVDAAGRRLLQAAPRRRGACLRGRADPSCCRRAVATRLLRDLSDVYARACASLPPVALRDLLDFRTERRSRCRSTRSNRITEIRKRFVAPGMSLGALSPEAHETLVHRHEPHRRASPTAARAARTRRASSRSANGDNAELRDQADRLGALRRHRGISQQLPRDRDQDRAGRQARRGRPAARLQGHRDDRAAAPCDAGRDADLARRRITTSTRSRIWRSSSTT